MEERKIRNDTLTKDELYNICKNENLIIVLLLYFLTFISGSYAGFIINQELQKYAKWRTEQSMFTDVNQPSTSMSAEDFDNMASVLKQFIDTSYINKVKSIEHGEYRKW
jgi:hypothetical protein